MPKEEKRKYPEDWKDCCKAEWETSKRPVCGLKDKTEPVYSKCCRECGTRIRPVLDCCNRSLLHGYRYCTKCGSYLVVLYQVTPN